jgi:hypothetical protein
MKNFSSFEKEDYFNNLNRLKESYNHSDDDYNEDDYDDDYDGDDDYDDSPDELSFFNSFLDDKGMNMTQGMERYMNEFLNKIHRNHVFEIGENVIYLGNTQNKKNQEGVVERIREDGKVVVRFKDQKLIAISSDHLVLKPSDEDRAKAKVEYDKRVEEEKKREQDRLERLKVEQERMRIYEERMRLEREAAEKKAREEDAKAKAERLKNPQVVEKWWERNKKAKYK